MDRFLTRLMNAQDRWTVPLGEWLRRLVSAIFRPIRPIKDFLNGSWLGHAVHPAVTDLPIGALGVAVVLDLLGQGEGAFVAIVIALLATLAAIVTGLADLTDTEGGALTRAALHVTIMVVATVLALVSLLLRIGRPPDAVAVSLGILAFLVMSAGAYVGGEIVFALGNMVSRHAWRGGGQKWLALEFGGELEEDVPTKAKAGAQTLVLVRRGETIHALHDQCAHAGGPLSGGRLVDDCIECPWHGSRYRLADGRHRRGPTTFDQPVYEVRRGESGWEARRVRV